MQKQRISIHDPRAGIDHRHLNNIRCPNIISIHDPRAGIDHPSRYQLDCSSCDFNPRPPCGDRLLSIDILPVPTDISIHDPRAGIDIIYVYLLFLLFGFQSTTPVRGSTDFFLAVCYNHKDFNPRPPCGDRQEHYNSWGFLQIFQSTTPVRGSTMKVYHPQMQRLHFNPRPPCGDRQQKFIKLTAQPTAKAAIPPITFCYRQRGMPFRS